MNPVPQFVSNTPDNTRCFQACAKMTMEHFNGTDKDLDYYDIYTGNSNKAKYTWPLRFAINASNDGMSVIYHDALNVEDLHADPHAYLTEEYGKQIADDQVKNSDLNSLKHDCMDFIQSDRIKKIYSTPTIQDLEGYVDEGYLVIANVNSRALSQKDGYLGHFVLVFECDLSSNRIRIHNPGLPAEEAGVYAPEDFVRGWAFGSEKYQNILAIRRS